MCVYVRERKREREWRGSKREKGAIVCVGDKKNKIERVCVCMCVLERERE